MASIVAGGLVVVIAAVWGISALAGQGSPTAAPHTSAKPTKSGTPSPTPTPTPTPTFNKAANSLTDPNSIWVVVNKLTPLNPQDYVPPDLVDVPVPHTWDPQLRQEASDAVVAMFAAAQSEAGLTLASNSAYRSYDSQVSIYGDGSDPTTAKPGHSEHQTGLAIDIGADSGNCSLNVCFADTPEGIWLHDNAWRFGFLLRYPADKVDVAGYPYEPWHYRYIGVPLATEMHNTGITTLEEFFGLPAAPDYAP